MHKDTEPEHMTGEGQVGTEAALAWYDGAVQQKTVSEHPMNEPSASQPRILVIEDNQDIATLLQGVLTSHGYHVDIVDDLSALQATREQLPDLILLDLLMPELPGDEAARRLQEMPDTQDIPIVLMSASPDLPRQAQALGVAGYLAKPFDLDDLLTVVQQALATRQDTT